MGVRGSAAVSSELQREGAGMGLFQSGFPPRRQRWRKARASNDLHCDVEQVCNN